MPPIYLLVSLERRRIDLFFLLYPKHSKIIKRFKLYVPDFDTDLYNISLQPTQTNSKTDARIINKIKLNIILLYSRF